MPENDLCDREHQADDAFASYEFGNDVEVVGHDGWDRSDPADLTKIVYVQPRGEDPEQDSERLSFHVRFNRGGKVEEAYALCMRTGAEVGSPGHDSLKQATHLC